MATAAELAGATDAEIAEARTALSAHLAASFPTLSVTSGPLADLVLGPAADALAAVEHRASAAEASLDPEEALASGDYDEEILSTALAGRGVTRGAAASASGTAALVFSTSTQKQIPTGVQFQTADGVYFKATASARMLPPGSTTVLESDRVLVSVPAGGYAGTIPIEAVETGASGNRPAGTVLSAVSTVADLTGAYAAGDLSGGADAETDAELLARLPSASAARTVGSFAGAEGVVRDAYPFSDVSVVGYGHEGMRRGRSVLTGQTPGRCDVRVRVSDAPGREVLRVTATYIEAVGGFGRWRCSVDAGDAPGWFAVERVVQVSSQPASGGYAPTVVVGYDTSGADDPPDVRSVADAFFSPYATAVVTFVDTATSNVGLTVNVSTRSYDVVLRTVPGVGDAQEAVDEEGVKAVGGDCLVRAAAPVLVSVTAAAIAPTGIDLTDDEVAAAVAAAVNASGIDAALNGSVVGAAAAALLPAGTTVQLSGWTGLVYYGDGTTGSVAGTSGLAVSTDWNLGVGPDVVAYYADPESVTATVT